MSWLFKSVTWILALVVGMFLASAVVYYGWARPSEASMRAYVEVDPAPPVLVFETAGRAAEARLPLELVMQNQMQRIRLDRVLRRALDNFETVGVALPAGSRGVGVASPLEWLREGLQVKATGNLLSVGLSGPMSSDQRATLINEVVYAYIADIGEERDALRSASDDLKRLGDKYRESLRRKREELQGSLGKGAADDPDRLAPDELGRLAERTLTDLARVESELRAARAEKAARAGDGTTPTPNPAPAAPDLDRRIRVLEEQARLTREDAARYARQAGESAPDLAIRRDEIRVLEGLVADVGRKLLELDVERDAPARIRIIDVAAPAAPKPAPGASGANVR
jgi:hypothetical protein